MILSTKGPKLKYRSALSKNWFQSFSRSEILQVIEITILVTSALIIFFQLHENSNQNRVSIRGQLYEQEAIFSKEGRDDDIINLSFVSINSKYGDSDYIKKFLSILTKDSSTINSKNAEDLYEAMWGYELLSDSTKWESNKSIRKVFQFAQSELYHIHNAFDYTQENILNPIEWKTWKGVIREMSGNPIFITTIWQGYKYHYFSKSFAKFLYNEICTSTPKDLNSLDDSLEYFRNRKLINNFYPQMLKPTWPDQMPDY